MTPDDPSTTTALTDAPEFSAPELTDALRAAGAIAADRRVTDVTAADMEGGYLARTVRLSLRYDGCAPGAPQSLVAKSPAAEEQPRAIAGWLGLYEREVGFYRSLAPDLDVRTPRCYLAESDPAAGSFALLLEDIDGATIHEQDSGCPLADARLAMGQLARLHAAHWNDPALAGLTWLNQLSRDQITGWHQLFVHAWETLRAREEARLDPVLDAVGQRLAGSDMVAWIEAYAGPLALTHADFHLTNLLFRHDPAGEREVVTIDWQMAMHAPPLIDVAYFLGRMPTDVRRKREPALLRAYHDQLLAAGVRGYAWEACERDYEHALWFGVLSAVAASAAYAMTPEETVRYMTKVERYLTQALDHDSLRFLG